MRPQDEVRSLAKYPIPDHLEGSEYDYGVVEKELVLTVILNIEDEVERLNKIISFLYAQREALLNRAVAEKITKDNTAYLLETLGKLNRNKITDIEAFTKKFPDATKAIREAQKFKLEQEIRKIDKRIKNIDKEPINLGDADKELGEAVVTEFVGTQPQVITYEVRRK